MVKVLPGPCIPQGWSRVRIGPVASQTPFTLCSGTPQVCTGLWAGPSSLDPFPANLTEVWRGWWGWRVLGGRFFDRTQGLRLSAQWQGSGDGETGLAFGALLSPTRLPMWARAMGGDHRAVPRHQAAVCNVTAVSAK